MFSLLSVRKNSVFILVFAEHVWILSYEFISETASKAVVRAAVVLFKLYERLTVGRRFGCHSACIPCTGDVVVFRLDFLQHVERFLAQCFVVLVFPVGEKHRAERIDYQ